MKVLLKNDVKIISDYLVSRTECFNLLNNKSPSPVTDKVELVTIGFQLDSSSWFSIVFDTRENATLDGEWTKFIDNNKTNLSQWTKALSQENAIDLIKMNGTKEIIDDELTIDHIKIVGDMIKEVMTDAKSEGVFSALPLGSNYSIVIEELNGQYSCKL